MSWFDFVNGSFEAFGAFAAWTNFFRLRRDGEVKGTVPALTLVYASWGLWNCIFYPLVGAWFSALVGAIMTAANVAWCLQVWKLSARAAERTDLISEEDPTLVYERRADKLHALQDPDGNICIEALVTYEDGTQAIDRRVVARRNLPQEIDALDAIEQHHRKLQWGDRA